MTTAWKESSDAAEAMLCLEADQKLRSYDDSSAKIVKIHQSFPLSLPGMLINKIINAVSDLSWVFWSEESIHNIHTTWCLLKENCSDVKLWTQFHVLSSPPLEEGVYEF